MDKDEMHSLSMLCLQEAGGKGKFEEIQKMLDTKSKSELYEILDYVVDNPFGYQAAIGIIVKKIYSDDNRFALLMCKLIERSFHDGAFGILFAPIEEIALEHADITISLSQKAMLSGPKPGFCSGFIITPLIGKGIIDGDIMNDLKSIDVVRKRQAMIAVGNALFKRDEKTAKLFIPILLEIACDVDHDDSQILINALIAAYRMDEKRVLPVLEAEMERRGYAAASCLIRTMTYRKPFPIDLFKKAVTIMEDEKHVDGLIDQALGQIYESDKEFIIERLRERLKSGKYPICEGSLEHHINATGAQPVIDLLEKEIDNGNWQMLYHGENILERFFPSDTDFTEWCKKWKDDNRKENIVLRSLAHILTERLNREYDKTDEDAITLVRDFVCKKKLDYVSETRHISFDGKEKSKESRVKALHIIREILHPRVQLDIENLQKTLDNFPNVCKAIGKDWLLRTCTAGNPHLLAYIYNRQVDSTKMKELENQMKSEKDPKKGLGIAIAHDMMASAINEKIYWENVFKILNEHNIKLSKRKLNNIEDAQSYLAEAEVLARLAPHFKIEIEPVIEEYKPKNLDVLIEHNGQKALIEIKAVKERVELQVAHGGISLPGGKVKNAISDKFEKQLKNGRVNPKMPVIIILCLHSASDFHDVEDAIYGQMGFYYKIRQDSQKTVESGVDRKDNSVYNTPNSDIITAIGAYSREYCKDPLKGRLYMPPQHIHVKNPMNKEFRLKLRNALFGESETSNWRSLMKIEGLDEKTARKLYEQGIEEIDGMALADESELTINGCDMLTMKHFQIEALRVINALATGSIKFLKGMDQETYDALIKKDIYLIGQIQKMDSPPENIPTPKWNMLIEDAKRIYSNES